MQGFLFRRQRGLPLAPTQPFRRLAHRLHGLRHIIGELFERRVGRVQFAASHALGQRLCLVAQFGLNAGEQPGVFLFLRCVLLRALELVPGGGDDLLLVLGNLRGLLATAPAAYLLRLRIRPLEWLGLDEEDIAAASGQRVARRCVNRDDVAGNELIIFQVKRGRSLGRSAFRPSQRHRFLRRAVH